MNPTYKDSEVFDKMTLKEKLIHISGSISHEPWRDAIMDAALQHPKGFGYGKRRFCAMCSRDLDYTWLPKVCHKCIGITRPEKKELVTSE